PDEDVRGMEIGMARDEAQRTCQALSIADPAAELLAPPHEPLDGGSMLRPRRSEAPGDLVLACLMARVLEMLGDPAGHRVRLRLEVLGRHERREVRREGGRVESRSERAEVRPAPLVHA